MVSAMVSLYKKGTSCSLHDWIDLYASLQQETRSASPSTPLTQCLDTDVRSGMQQFLCRAPVNKQVLQDLLSPHLTDSAFACFMHSMHKGSPRVQGVGGMAEATKLLEKIDSGPRRPRFSIVNFDVSESPTEAFQHCCEC